jgi:hypothetical protein
MNAPRNQPGSQGDDAGRGKVQQGGTSRGTPGGSGTTDRDHGGQASRQSDQGRGAGNQASNPPATDTRRNGSGTELNDID